MNIKEKLFKILNKKKFILFINEENQEISNHKVLDDVKKIILYLDKYSKKKILIPFFKKKYNFIILYLSCIFSDRKIYPTNEIDQLANSNKFVLLKDSIFDKFLKKKINTEPKISFLNKKFIFLETTGTTSIKKIMFFKSNDYLNACNYSKKLFNYNNKNILIHCLPINYNAGINNLLFSAIFGEAKIIISQNYNFFEAEKIINRAIKFNVNTLQLMPSMFANLLYLKNKRINKFIKNCSNVISTGSYLYEELNNKFYKIYNRYIENCYGITELGGPISVTNYNKSKIKPINNFVGRINKEIKVKIKRDKILQLNTPFQISGFTDFKKEINLTNKKKFLNTGDKAIVKKKSLFIIGRVREIAKRGGEMISLKKIENIALRYNYITACICITKKNIFSDEDIIMFVETNKNNNEFKKQLFKYLSINLKKNHLPSKLFLMNKFKYFHNGKINVQMTTNL